MADDRDKIVDALTEAGRQAQKPSANRNASKWFREKFNELFYGTKHRPLGKAANVKPNKLPGGDLDNTVITPRMTQRNIGRMAMFVYDPKTKDKLPYYDTLPLVIVVGFKEDGFVGLNLHYLHPLLRIKILEALVRNINPSKLESGFHNRNVENKLIMKNYQILYEASKLPILNPCFKRYLYSHVRTNYMFIDPPEWPKAILLRYERFRKASKVVVFAESAKKAAAASTAPKHHVKEAVAKPAVKLSTNNKTKSIFEDGK